MSRPTFETEPKHLKAAAATGKLTDAHVAVMDTALARIPALAAEQAGNEAEIKRLIDRNHEIHGELFSIRESVNDAIWGNPYSPPT